MRRSRMPHGLSGRCRQQDVTVGEWEEWVQPLGAIDRLRHPDATGPWRRRRLVGPVETVPDEDGSQR